MTAFSGAICRQTQRIEGPADREAGGPRMAVRRVRDTIRRHVGEFLGKHHHPKSGRGESAWN
jgi:hypothetical protein